VRIVYLLESSGLSGGAKVAFQQAEELGRRGHDVAVVCPEPPPDWFELARVRYESAEFEESKVLERAEVAVATFWTTVEPALSRARGAVFHLCQGYEADFSFYADRRDRIEAAYRRRTHKLAVAPHLAERLEREGLGPVTVVGQTFEAAEFRCEGRPPGRRPLRVLVPGIGTGDLKGVAEALDALSELRRGGGDFLVARVSAHAPSAAERRLGVADEFHESIAPNRMPALLASVDVLVAPSHEVEGFDLPLLEGLAAGLPCAASDTPAHRHSAGDAALFFAPRHTAGIVDAVGRLLAEPAERARLWAAGPERASRFRTSDVADRLEDVFRREAGRA
jgi:glycosyltransferase involved in cell wall biosynthesis